MLKINEHVKWIKNYNIKLFLMKCHKPEKFILQFENMFMEVEL